jgi:hypothetical protein
MQPTSRGIRTRGRPTTVMFSSCDFVLSCSTSRKAGALRQILTFVDQAAPNCLAPKTTILCCHLQRSFAGSRAIASSVRSFRELLMLSVSRQIHMSSWVGWSVAIVPTTRINGAYSSWCRYRSFISLLHCEKQRKNRAGIARGEFWWSQLNYTILPILLLELHFIEGLSELILRSDS